MYKNPKDSLLYSISNISLIPKGGIIMIKDSFTLFRELLSNPTSEPTLEDFYNKALEKGLNKDEALKEAKLAYDCYNKFVKNNRI